MGLLPVSTVDSNCSSTLWCYGPVVDANIINQAGEETARVQLPVCNLFNWWNYLKQVLSKDDKVLDIYYAVSPGHWANVA